VAVAAAKAALRFIFLSAWFLVGTVPLWRLALGIMAR